MIEDIRPEHHAKLLQMNAEFVHWLSPLDQVELVYVLDRAAYARQIMNGTGVLIGYAHDVNYPDHWNLAWLKTRLEGFFYIDRVIIDRASQGQGVGRQLYADVAQYAKSKGYVWLACEVNTVPDNPGSHAFHVSEGFKPLGEQAFPDSSKAVRYYAKALN